MSKKPAARPRRHPRPTCQSRGAFKTYAARHDLKLNELLRRSFEAYRQAQGE